MPINWKTFEGADWGKAAKAAFGGAAWAKKSPFGPRDVYRDAGMALGGRANRTTASWMSRGVAGAATGALAGGAWGAISDRESVVTGAMKGAVAGAAFRVGARMAVGSAPGLRKLNKFSSSILSLQRLNNTGKLGDNLKRSWDFMGQGRRATVRNWAVGMAGVGAFRGIIGGEDNPIGGGVGGTIAGGIQGAAIGGGWLAAKRMFGRR